MSVSYDIFDLIEFPVIVTDEKFVIKYKNLVAYQLFPKIRKGSNMMRHSFDDIKNAQISNLCEIELKTGTHLTRALVFSHPSSDIFFVFLSRIQSDDSKQLIKRINEAYKGNFWDFYISAYSEYITSQRYRLLHKDSCAPPRLYNDLTLLMNASFVDPAFTKRNVYDIAELVSAISKKVSRSLCSLGLKMMPAEISKEAKDSCFCKINLNDFIFVVLRMIYIAFKNSSDSCIKLSMDHLDSGYSVIDVSTKTSLCDEMQNAELFNKLNFTMSELSFEFEFLRKTNVLDSTVECKIEDSVLHLGFKVQSLNRLDSLVLFSMPPSLVDAKIAKFISLNTSKVKDLLSK